jgi:hypothetical protein
MFDEKKTNTLAARKLVGVVKAKVPEDVNL